MNKTSHKGAYGEALVIADLITYGIIPHESFVRDTPYDILASANGVYKRIQVKYRKTTQGFVEVTPRSRLSITKLKKNIDYDILAIVNERGHVAYMATEEFESSIRLRVIQAKPRYRSQTKYFYNYKNPTKYFTNE